MCRTTGKNTPRSFRQHKGQDRKKGATADGRNIGKNT